MQRQAKQFQKQLAMPLVGMMLLLTGCATPSGDCSFLPLREYDNAFQEKLANELEKAGDKTAFFLFVEGEIELRDAVRACKGQKAE